MSLEGSIAGLTGLQPYTLTKHGKTSFNELVSLFLTFVNALKSFWSRGVAFGVCERLSALGAPIRDRGVQLLDGRCGGRLRSFSLVRREQANKTSKQNHAWPNLKRTMLHHAPQDTLVLGMWLFAPCREHSETLDAENIQLSNS